MSFNHVYPESLAVADVLLEPPRSLAKAVTQQELIVLLACVVIGILADFLLKRKFYLITLNP